MTTMRSARVSSSSEQEDDSYQWDKHYKQLKRFFKRQGHSRVPSTSELSAWVKQQRDDRRQGTLSQERRSRLDKLDFYWGPKQPSRSQFDEMLQQWQDFCQRKGHARVSPNSALGVWCQKQTTKLRDNTLSPDHRARLEAVGFFRKENDDDDHDNDDWDHHYRLLHAFYQDHGHYVIPKTSHKNALLYTWVKRQRKAYRDGRLSKDHTNQLDAIHFLWTEAEAVQHQTTWDRNYEKLARFRTQRGHSFVQRSDDLALWRWTEKNDWKQRRSILPRKHYERLDALGFWDPPPENLSERNEKNAREDVAFVVKGEGKKPKQNNNKKTTTIHEDSGHDSDESEAEDDDDDDDSEEEYFEDSEEEDDILDSSDADDDDDDDDDIPTRTKSRRSAFRKPKNDNDTKQRSHKRLRRSSTFDSTFKTLYQVGTKVMKYFDEHGWFEGEIISIYEQNVYKIRYEDEDEETYLIPNEKKELDQIVRNAEVLRHPVGTRVKKYFEDYGWYEGKVVSQEKDRYKIRYDDGDKEEYIFDNDMEELDEIVANARSQ